MNTEDSEFARIEREQAIRGAPDPIHHTDPVESLEYITGWNDCRQAMLEQPAQLEVCCGDYGKCMKPCTPRGKWLAEQPAPVQQEPAAVVSGYYGGQCVILPIDPARIFNSNTPLYTTPQAQSKPLTLQELIAAWNAQADHMNTWNELGLDEIVAWAQAAHNKENQS